MLSTENPSVDPSCSSSSQLIKRSSSKICNDEKDSVHSHQQLQDELDLLKQGLDEDKKPALNFSIRDYVFSTRAKDIEIHWPFAPKNLQLCLKHGISNVLPPFETLLRSVRNSSTVESKAQEHPNLSIPSSSKAVRNTQNPVTKSELSVKLGDNACEPKASKESMKTNVVVCDSMASKVCPVCKTFSSSSNTTLNAHIDQCLSCGPPSNWMVKSRTVKNRVKPRKTRLMVDIYKTALPCTIEDLDRRNGTNWASNSKQAMDVRATSSVPPMATPYANIPDHRDVEGSVYVDSTGTKLWNLSKLSDIPCNANGMDDRSLNKFLSSKKMKYRRQNRKLLKSSYNVKSLRHNPKAIDGARKHVYSQDLNKCDLRQPLELHDRKNSGDFGLVKKWVGSKRTHSRKKPNCLVHERHLVRQTTKDFRVANRLSSHCDSEFGNGINDSSVPLLSEKITSSSSESCKRGSHDGHREQRVLRKRTDHNHHGKNKTSHLSLIKCEGLHKVDTSERKSCNEQRPSDSKDGLCSNGEKQIITNASPVVRMSQSRAFSSGTKELASQKNLSFGHKVLSSPRKLSPLKRNLPPHIRHASVSAPRKSTLENHSKLKKRRLLYASESDDESIVHRSAICKQDELVETLCEDSSQNEKKLFNKPTANRYDKDLKAQKNSLAYRSSDLSTSSGSAGLFIGKNSASRVCTSRKELAAHTTSLVVEGTASTAFDKYLDAALHYVNACNEVAPSELVFVDKRETFPLDNDDDDLVMTNGIDGNKVERGYYERVDPIPIPGPPGSFLPSPGRMGSDELQGKSSLTTSRLHTSEEDEHEVFDMDSSDSPTSVISNSIINGPDSISAIDASKYRSSVPADIQSDHDANTYHAAESSLRFGQTRKQLDSESKANTVMLSEMSQYGLIKDGQLSSCCPRKYGVCQGDYLDYQEPLPAVRQCTLNSISLHPVGEKQVYGDMSYNKLDSFNSRSEVLDAKELPITEAHKVSANSSTVYPCYESPTPSTPNPILRLMGKNLMVMNNEEIFSPGKTRPASDKNMEHRPKSYNTILDRGVSMLGNGQTTVNSIEFDAGGGFWKPEYFPRKNHPFYSYEADNYHPFSSAAHMVQINAYNQVPFPMGLQENVEKGKFTEENPRMLHANSFTGLATHHQS